MIDQRIVESFHTMWGPFPEPVMLIHKDRTIIAVNELARSIGMTDGIKCHAMNPENAPDNHCQRCKANLALSTCETVCSNEQIGETALRAYWMPLKEVPDVYVHFSIGVAETLNKSRPALPQ